MKQLVNYALCGVAAAMSASTFAVAPKQPKGAGVVRSITQTTVVRRADGALVTTVTPVKDIAGFFRSQGLPVPPISTQDCDPLSPGGGYGGGGGDGGGGGQNPAPPPSSDSSTAVTMLPPVTVTEDSNVIGFTEGVNFVDGWSDTITWARSPGPPPGAWVQTSNNWRPPGAHGNGTGGSTQTDCDEDPD